MLTINVANQTLAISLSIIFVTVLSICFLSDFCLIALSKNLVKSIKENEQKQKTKSNTDKYILKPTAINSLDKEWTNLIFFLIYKLNKWLDQSV